MKTRQRFVLFVCLLAMGMCGSAWAAEEGVSPMGKMHAVIGSNHFDKDWGYSLGLKAWVNEWDAPFTYTGLSGLNMAVVQFKSDTEFTFIPAFMVRYKNFFIGGSYMPKTEYDFNAQTLSDIYLEEKGVDYAIRTEIEGTAEREEWDLNIGYFLTPNLGLSLGYKNIDRDYTLTDTREIYRVDDGATEPLDPVIENLSGSVHGPILGLSASLPVGNNFGFYGNVAYGWLNGTYDGNYYLGDLGLNYVIPLQRVVSAIAINAGYRFQRLELDAKSGTNEEDDSTSGFILGVTASF